MALESYFKDKPISDLTLALAPGSYILKTKREIRAGEKGNSAYLLAGMVDLVKLGIEIGFLILGYELISGHL